MLNRNQLIAGIMAAAAFEGCFYGMSINAEAATQKGLVIENGVLESGMEAEGVVEIPSNVKEIETAAFKENKKITKVIIPSTCKKVGALAFYDCEALTEVKIDSGVETVGSCAFSNSVNLQKVDVNPNKTHLSTEAFALTKYIDSIRNNDGFAILDGILLDAREAKGDVTIPNDVKIINDGAFYENDRVTSVKMSDSVKQINANAFEGTYILENVKLSNKLEKLGYKCFACSGLTEINIPDSVTEIQDAAFFSNSYLKKVRLPNGLKSIGRSEFADCEELTEINIPDSVTEIKFSAFLNTKNLKEINLPRNVQRIEDAAFKNSGLRCVQAPSSLTFVGPNSFDKNVQIKGDVNAYNKAISDGTKIHNQDANKDYISYSGLGWVDTEYGRFYKKADGTMTTGWLDLNGKKYYFYSNGKMATEFIDLNGTHYYFDPASGNNYGNVVTGWKKINDKWYYFNPVAEGNKEKGFMKTSWLYNGGAWYYLYSNGTMATGFINLNGAYYYLNPNSGAMVTGWKYMNGAWYYFNKRFDGGVEGLMKKGWQKINGTWYYFYPSDGKMAHNTRINGYYLNSSGAWVK